MKKILVSMFAVAILIASSAASAQGITAPKVGAKHGVTKEIKKECRKEAGKSKAKYHACIKEKVGK